jgi:hypothetical protein
MNIIMKALRVLLIVGAAACLLCPPATLAQSTTTPTVVPQDRNDADLLRDLQGAPDNVKTLIVAFDQVADKYLMQQRALLLKLKGASTTEQRQAIREQLQDNRQAFMAELKTFRQDLKSDLTALKGKITHTEVVKILDAAKVAAATTHARRGQ